jgi:hypothetical protein
MVRHMRQVDDAYYGSARGTVFEIQLYARRNTLEPDSRGRVTRIVFSRAAEQRIELDVEQATKLLRIDSRARIQVYDHMLRVELS